MKPDRGDAARSATLADRAAAVAALGPWFHNIVLPDGLQTAPDHFLGSDFPAFKWRQVAVALPTRLDGWEVLDVGCNAGYYSFELARLGARVHGVDVDPRYLAQARWAARELRLDARVSFEQCEVFDLARSSERYDLVLFMGVFYHLRYPLLALDILARLTRRQMVFQTLTMPGMGVHGADPIALGLNERDTLLDEGWPKMAFFETGFAGDPTNWWAPNHAGVEAMLRSSGLRVMARPGHEIYLCEPDPAQAWRRERFASQWASVVGTRDAGSARPEGAEPDR
ncbi:MAG: TIGR04290 family methyltransferase [Lautropia sp.]